MTTYEEYATYREFRKARLNRTLKAKHQGLQDSRPDDDLYYSYQDETRGMEAKRHRNRRVLNLIHKQIEDR